ncbi:MAG: hypothetical protein K9H16_03780, partial [Bacteroidales bacterium]|nr:hypothetical protein [Bacteroidales bacterium]
MTDLNTIGHFQEIIKESFNQELLIKISLGKTKSKITELKNVFIRPVMLHGEMLLSFTYRYLTQDKTQNHNLQEALQIIKGLLDKDFMQANLFDNSRDVQLMISKKGKITINMLKPSMPLLQTLNHDKIKMRLIEPEGRQYLQQLGVTNSNF